MSAENFAAGRPCVRCGRELKECVFTKERPSLTKQRTSTAGDGMRTDTSVASLPLDEVPHVPFNNPHRSNDESEQILTHAHQVPLSIARQDAEQRNSLHGHERRPLPTEALREVTASFDRYTPAQRAPTTLPHITGLVNPVMQTVVSSDKDALDLLFRAARQHDDCGEDQQHTHSRRSATGVMPAMGGSTQDTPSLLSPVNLQTASFHPTKVLDASSNVLEIWNACRFVKMGWFSAKEAVLYIDL
jgi:hypothetical protein